MAEEVGLARRFRTEVNLGTTAAPVWATLPGVQEFTPKRDNTQKDTTHYDGNGAMGNTVTAYSWENEYKMLHYLDDATLVENPAQASFRLASEAILAANKREIRWYDRFGGPEAYQGRVTTVWNSDGGKVEDLNLVTLTLTGDGERTIIANPVAAAPPAAIVSALDTVTGPTAGGTLVKITGAWFVNVTGAAAVKFGAVNAADYRVDDIGTIYALSPAGSAGAVNVRVTNVTGQSATGAGNVFTYV